jgi:hypothetical protein
MDTRRVELELSPFKERMRRRRRRRKNKKRISVVFSLSTEIQTPRTPSFGIFVLLTSLCPNQTA